MSSFYVENFGCRATQADGAAIEQQFQQHGLQRASSPEEAEILILNSCTVTAAADRDTRARVRHIHRENPGCHIVITGCYAQRAPAEVAALPGVTSVIGNSDKHRLAQITLHPQSFVPLSSLASSAPGQIFVSDIFAHTELLAAPVFDSANERTRPNLKVQDGCDNRCAFCIIPSVRGHSRSLKLADIICQVNALVGSGYRELVVSGINLGRWGRDLEKPLRFEHLVSEILSQTTLEKLRISSVEPMDWSHELIGIMAASPRIAKHAHVPMQSGSDRVLRAMHRKYRPWHYRAKIEEIRAAMPTAAIGADVMTGFPGETEADFEETRRIAEELPFTYLHVFTYSSRPGTPAATLPGHLPVHIARDRNGILRELAAQKKLSFQRSFIGHTLSAITLHAFDGVYTEALTDNYLKLLIRGQHPPNRWKTAKVDQVFKGALVGDFAPAPAPR